MDFNREIKQKYNKALRKVMKYYNLDIHSHTQDTKGLLHLNVSDIIEDFEKIIAYGGTPEENNSRIEPALQKEYPYLLPFRRISTAFTFGTTVITRNEFAEINDILKIIKQLDKINSKNA
jgi:hypothetical protein